MASHRRLRLLGRHIAGAAQVSSRDHLAPHVVVTGPGGSDRAPSPAQTRILLQTEEDAAGALDRTPTLSQIDREMGAGMSDEIWDQCDSLAQEHCSK